MAVGRRLAGALCVLFFGTALVVPVAVASVTPLLVRQSVDSAAKVPGARIHYTVTATNRGGTALADAKLSDDLSNLLDDAAYQNDAKASLGHLEFRGGTLFWHGPLDAGRSVSITYSVVIDDPDRGDHVLESRVSGDGFADARDVVPMPLNHGDAPDGYQSTAQNNGPTESASNKLFLGATPSGPGVRSFPPLNSRMTSYSLSVAVTNTTGAAARLAGWIDLNGDGVFDAAERAQAVVMPGASSVTLSWRRLHGVRGTQTYVRLRLDQPVGASSFSGGLLPYGPGGIGEVEDYRVPVVGSALTQAVTFRKTADRYRARPGDRIRYRITVTNNTFNTIGGISFRDDLSRVLDDADYDGNATGGATYRGGTLWWRGVVRPNRPVTITYSVTMRSRGDGVLDNSVVSDNAGQNCRRGSRDPYCHVRVVRARRRGEDRVVGFGCRERCGGFGGHGFEEHGFGPHSLGEHGFGRHECRKLPFTGEDIDAMVRMAASLVALGVVMTALGGRRQARRRHRANLTRG